MSVPEEKNAIGTVPVVGDKGGTYEKNSGSDLDEGVVLRDNADQLQRHLGNRQIQLIAIGGAIGTAIFVSIGSGLQRGGPGSLFLAFTIQGQLHRVSSIPRPIY